MAGFRFQVSSFRFQVSGGRFQVSSDRFRVRYGMKRQHDKYGRGSAAANGAEFVDLETNKDADSERTPRGAISEDLNSAPFQNLASQLASRIACYVGDVNWTRPVFLARSEAFSVETAAELIMGCYVNDLSVRSV